eukprot:gene8848-gene9600
MLTTRDTFQIFNGWLKLLAFKNMASMSVTLLTSHRLMSSLNSLRYANKNDMSVTPLASQLLM